MAFWVKCHGLRDMRMRLAASRRLFAGMGTTVRYTPYIAGSFYCVGHGHVVLVRPAVMFFPSDPKAPPEVLLAPSDWKSVHVKRTKDIELWLCLDAEHPSPVTEDPRTR